MKRFRLPQLSAYVLVALLSGCGGGGDDGGSEESSSSANQGRGSPLEDGIFGGESGEESGIRPLLVVSAMEPESTLDMAPFIPPGESLTGVEIAEQAISVCHAPHLVPPTDNGQQQLELQVDSVGLCRLQLTLAARSGEPYQRPLTVNYTTTPDIQIPTLGEAYGVNQTATINLTSNNTIKSLIDQGYGLSIDSLGTAGTITAGVIDSDGNGIYESITINSGDVLGPNRITYLLEKTGEHPDSKTGVIDITVSASPNSRPQILQPNYTVVDLTSPGDQVEINLLNGADKIISDPDNEGDLKLVQLAAPMGGTVIAGTFSSPLENLDTATDTFHFSADAVGEYQVNYTVSDQQDGYASGVVNINVGKLTSPNTPLAATPGRMVEWTTVSDDEGNELVIYRPVLFDEVQAVANNPLPDGDFSTRNGERWSFATRQLSTAFCQQYNMRPITATAYRALLHKLQATDKQPEPALGWPEIAYIVQSTDYTQRANRDVVNGVTGDFTEASNGGLICVRYRDRMMTATPPGTEEAPITLPTGAGENQTTVTIGQINGSGALGCVSRDTNIVTAACSAVVDGTATLTLTAGTTPGETIVTVSSPRGEYLLGNEPPLAIFVTVDHPTSTGPPTLTTYQLEAQCDPDNSSNWIKVIENTVINENNLQLVRPGTPLRLSWTFQDPDPWQQTDATTVTWTGATPNPTDQKQATVDAIKPVQVTLTPRSSYKDGTEIEQGTPITMTLNITNRPPVIENLDITPDADIRNNTAFDQNTLVSASYTYSDPNNDPQGPITRYFWEQKRPWTNNWAPVTDDGKALETKVMPLTAEFFTVGGRYEGNDLRLRMIVQDKFSMNSPPAIQAIIPVATEPTTTIAIRGPDEPNPLLLHRTSDFTGGFNRQDINWYDQMCREIPASRNFTQIRLLRKPSLDELQQQKKTPAYWSPLFVSHPKMPFATGGTGNDAVGMWSASTGAVLTQPAQGATFTDASLVCEEVLMNLGTYPQIARVMMGNTLQLTMVMEDDRKDQMMKIPPENIIWHSDTPDIVEVTNGIVTPKKTGTGIVTATLKGTTRTWNIGVVPLVDGATIPYCGGKINSLTTEVARDNNRKCVTVSTDHSGNYMTGGLSEVMLNALGFSYDPSGLTPRSYQQVKGDNLGWHPTNVPVGQFIIKDDINNRITTCEALNGITYAGRTDWTQATLDQMKGFTEEHGASYLTTTGWPRQCPYSTGEPDIGYNISMDALEGNNPITPVTPETLLYTSCFSPTPGSRQ